LLNFTPFLPPFLLHFLPSFHFSLSDILTSRTPLIQLYRRKDSRYTINSENTRSRQWQANSQHIPANNQETTTNEQSRQPKIRGEPDETIDRKTPPHPQINNSQKTKKTQDKMTDSKQTTTRHDTASIGCQQSQEPNKQKEQLESHKRNLQRQVRDEPSGVSRVKHYESTKSNIVEVHTKAPENNKRVHRSSITMKRCADSHLEAKPPPIVMQSMQAKPKGPNTKGVEQSKARRQ
jgi:hypothetical protein